MSLTMEDLLRSLAEERAGPGAATALDLADYSEETGISPEEFVFSWMLSRKDKAEAAEAARRHLESWPDVEWAPKFLADVRRLMEEIANTDPEHLAGTGRRRGGRMARLRQRPDEKGSA